MEGNMNNIIFPSLGLFSDPSIQESIRVDDYLDQVPKQQPSNHLNQRSQSYPPHYPGQALISCTGGVRPPRPIRPKKDCAQFISFMDLSKEKDDERFSITFDDGSSVVSYDEAFDKSTETSKGSSDWRRVKWSDEMVRLLITVVSYISGGGDGAASKKNTVMLQKKGKWRWVSQAMAEKGFYISPQQCEDKFNDLNKRYKRLNGILGEGTAYEIVEKPQLLDVFDHLSARTKDEVNKILSSKQLFYKEMCCYHNGNTVQHSITLQHSPCCDHTMESGGGDRDNDDDHRSKGAKKAGQDHEKGNNNIISQVFTEGSTGAWFYKQWMKSRLLEFEEKNVQIQMEIMEIQEQCLNWQELRKRKNRRLDMLRMKNQRMKFENKSMELQLKQRELLSDSNDAYG